MFKNVQDHVLLLFLIVVALASGADIVADIKEGVNKFHLFQELIVLVIAVIGFVFVGRNLLEKTRELKQLKEKINDLKHLPEAAAPEVVESRRRMSEAIQLQFKCWNLTKSEQEIGLLLLKGFSLKEISTLRGTSEKTIRQQASAIYKKAGVSGRHMFSAWFIEDFL